MTTELILATIDGPGVVDFKLEDSIGVCDGSVQGFDQNSVIARVFPIPEKCEACPFGENNCTESRAD
ncbi:MAG: hypothetical protein QY322_03100 [bacterium]|nr:MAG: hypothetical protein QY322_03100 [bacterium]